VVCQEAESERTSRSERWRRSYCRRW